MSSRLAVRRGVQEPQILHLPPDVVSHDAATEAIELAESCGLYLDESQRITLQVGMGQRADGKWAAFQVGDVQARQNGKTDTVTVRELHSLFVDGNRLIVHTAHESKTADEAFLRVEELISNNSELKAQVARFRYGNGDHAVELASGNRLLYKTRTGGAARGFSGAALLVYDEALFLQAKHVSASLSILSRGRTKSHNPQMWALSSAGLETSTFLWEMRLRAISGNGGRLGYVEHTAETFTVVDGKVRSNRNDLDLEDRDLWALANPAMNHPDHGISEEFIEAEKRAQSFDPEGWARERLCIWNPPPEMEGGGPISLARWAELVDPDSAIVGPVSRAIDVSPDFKWASIAAAGRRTDGHIHVEVGRRSLGTDWIVPFVKAQGAEFRLAPSSPAGFLIPLLVEAGVDVVEVTQQEMTQACSRLLFSVAEGTVHSLGGNELPAAISNATISQRGDVQAWSRVKSSGDISALVAVTIAVGGVVDLYPAIF